MIMLPSDKWTVVAKETFVRGLRKWQWEEGFSEDLLFHALRDEIILMHKRNRLHWDLVARLPGVAWQRMAAKRRRRFGV